jgi:hypothetical protein
MRLRLLLVPVASVFLSACGGATDAPTPFRLVADVRGVMNAVIDPGADAIWGSVGTIITEQGTEERFPKNDEEWAVVENGALAVAEGSNLLMMDSRAVDREEWIRLSLALIEVSQQTLKAVEARDKQAVFDLGGDIYAVCTNCHSKYAMELGRVS